MQMIMMVFRSSLDSAVLTMVEQQELPFTRLESPHGQGTTGSVAGTSLTVTGTNTVLLMAVPDEHLTRFRERVQQFQTELENRAKSVTVPFHTFVLPCIQWF